MTKGVFRLEGRGAWVRARIVWVLESVKPGESEFSSGVPDEKLETLVDYGARDMGGPVGAWRCAGCKVVSFAYPQETAHW